METPGAAAPWLVLGLVLGALLPLLAALAGAALRRRGAPGGSPGDAPPAGAPVDDLPGFLEAPPGSAPAAPVRGAGWAPLGGAPAPAAPLPPRVRRERTGSREVLVGMALAAVLLVGAAAAVATGRAPDGAAAEGTRPGPTTPSAGAGARSVTAELVFEGLVLERHPVGVTVAVPRVRLTAGGGRATADVELVTFNCLRGDAPPDPAAAGCTRSVTEHAQLSGPELDVRLEGGVLRVSGAFPTWRRPTGSPPVATGRVYDLAVTAAPRDGRAGDGPEAAAGLLELGDERARTRDDGASTISYAG
ncbi:hypothetical protein [Blastococcus tunisiensis]|uniref:Uncharacterized protein n=1 Tax=Blastococcus tunisiensis TaxID=1798228 RepID=A0A1I1WJH8_9ACTN|nr:hypothetical protein [Blastococcus sp. DSM 46838]SFD95364.1 hypothetical protein SAMN05216574_101411 [Blastococcus sp. DSM 46838]